MKRVKGAALPFLFIIAAEEMQLMETSTCFQSSLAMMQ